MRKICCLIILLCAIVAQAQAQDIIITSSSEKIEAKIDEVSTNQIKYKKFSNLEGPTFIIETNKVSSILFSNGDVMSFSKDIEEKNVPDTGSYTKLEKIDKKHYIYGDLEINGEKEYMAFLKNNCQDAYKKYYAGNQLVIGGWAMFVPGSVLEITGIILLAKNKNEYKSVAIGTTCCVFGSLLEVGAIPCWIVGGIKKAKSVDVFNSKCAQNFKPTDISFQLQMSNNGLGIAMNF